ncbi:hypothetical protein [Rubripirellula amarantea]|uniref:hypothetical protein n=1 Tax=Rubripirellula amarantea TaxID=2527999 RepID=UPI0011B77894|nr:hypothetical protein [Rubripirellula amarantea]
MRKTPSQKPSLPISASVGGIHGQRDSMVGVPGWLGDSYGFSMNFVRTTEGFYDTALNEASDA